MSAKERPWTVCSGQISSSQAFGDPKFPQILVLVLDLMCMHMLPRDFCDSQQPEPSSTLADCISIDINTLQYF